MLVDRDPARDAFRIGAAIGRTDLAIMRRLFPDMRDGDAPEEVGDFFIRNGAGRAADDETAQPLRPPRGVVERDEAAAGDAEQMESFELEMSHERLEIAGNTAR